MEDDACLNLPNTSLLLCYNPAQVLKMGGKHYLTGPVILVRTNMDGEVISLTIDEVYLFQKYLASHSITLMADDQRLPPGSVQKGTAQLQSEMPVRCAVRCSLIGLCQRPCYSAMWL